MEATMKSRHDPMQNMADIRGTIARGWCHDPNRDKVMDPDLAEAIAIEVAATLGIVYDK